MDSENSSTGKGGAQASSVPITCCTRASIGRQSNTARRTCCSVISISEVSVGTAVGFSPASSIWMKLSRCPFSGTLPFSSSATRRPSASRRTPITGCNTIRTSSPWAASSASVESTRNGMSSLMMWMTAKPFVTSTPSFGLPGRRWVNWSKARRATAARSAPVRPCRSSACALRNKWRAKAASCGESPSARHTACATAGWASEV